MEHTDEGGWLGLAKELGFADACLIDTGELVFNSDFRRFCEDDLCGMYDRNPSCPPACGTPEQLKARLCSRPRAIVLRSAWRIDYRDQAAVDRAKRTHNENTLTLIDRIGRGGVMAGASACTLCAECAGLAGGICPRPKERWSCLSAYCVDVRALADRCGMEYFAADGSISFFSVYAFGPERKA